MLLFLPLALLLVAPVHATTPTLVTGSILANGTGTLTESRTSGGNTFSTFFAPVKFTGGIQAQGTVTEFLIVTSTGFATARATGTLSGTVSGGGTGSFDVLLTATATASGNTFTNVQGQLTLGSGTAGLAGLHGQGTVGEANSVPTYSVQVHFDP